MAASWGSGNTIEATLFTTQHDRVPPTLPKNIYHAKRRKYKRYSILVNSNNDIFSKWREGYLEMICKKWSEKVKNAELDYRVRKIMLGHTPILRGVSNVIE